ncbi:efflux RND transporter periplasmic adaptor subunit [Veillonella rodentium]|uniref:Macrolide-specific efflux protein macA n=1 Tax=Veillonella rodentium TaxID=248315 RepID=A0A239Z7G6_9FIRM|nr:efflux RND transporter periplasmic adaptor subunit [Veillonella rodentium]SNV67025.1 Macrolide-specific efflux protein macA precursor [Veillonella rodentium]
MKEFFRKHRKRIITGAVVLCVLGGGAYYYINSDDASQSQKLYTTGKVEKGDVKTSISATGTINPVNYVDVSTNVAGKLESVLVKENDQVTAGQVIAYIDTRQLQATVDDARAAMSKAELDMNRYKALVDQNAIAQQKYDDSVTDYERAKSVYDKAVADLSDATITAPMAGTVVGTPLKAGQTISTGISTQMIIATIADLSNLEIYLTVDETDIGNIKNGSRVEFTVDSKPGETFTGYVSEIAKGTKGELGKTSTSVVYYIVKVAIPQDIAGNFLPTMTARATIFGDDIKNTLVVPLTAVRTDKQGEYVYVIKDGQPVRTAVSTGVTGDTNVQILKGLSEGDEIIVSGDVTAPKSNVGGPF